MIPVLLKNSTYYVNISQDLFPKFVDKYLLDTCGEFNLQWTFDTSLIFVGFYKYQDVFRIDEESDAAYYNCVFILGDGYMNESNEFQLHPHLEKEFTYEKFLKREGVFEKEEWTKSELRDVILSKKFAGYPLIFLSRNQFDSHCVVSSKTIDWNDFEVYVKDSKVVGYLELEDTPGILDDLYALLPYHEDSDSDDSDSMHLDEAEETSGG